MVTHPSVLVLNAGSSSLKFSIRDPQSGSCHFQGLAEKLLISGSQIKFQDLTQEKTVALPEKASLKEAVQALVTDLEQRGIEFGAIGHRVVHGGERYACTQKITPELISEIEGLIPLAPLHNPGNLAGIYAAQAHWPDLPQFAVFDTAFHQTMPEHCFRYALPEQLYTKHHIRRYGFHGLSHQYITEHIQQLAPTTNQRLISAHLGNGCSLAAILEGRSVDTTMGFTPLEGLVMGTRSGDLDPGVLLYLQQGLNYSVQELEKLLNKQSGLLGLSGFSSDYRELVAAADQGQASAELALKIFAYRIARQIASLTVPLGGLDQLVFTGGIGENAAPLRSQVITQLAHLGLKLDPQKNQGPFTAATRIDQGQSPGIWVIPTQEDLMIAKEVARKQA